MSESVKLEKVMSGHKGGGKPTLSILIPYYRDDPSDLLLSLTRPEQLQSDVEILIYDDGTNDADLNAHLIKTVEASVGQVTLLIAKQNKGRSFARNILKNNAEADWVLFLDADMRPVSKTFIVDYLAHVRANECDIIFGGFEVSPIAADPERELHRAFSLTSDCLTLAERQRHGPQYVCSSNLCVKKSVIDAEPFDPEFVGWGWEDSEWAARTAQEFKLVHADIPALHLGLETTDTLLKRFRESGPNYLRFTKKHPELARTLTLFKMTQRLKHIPGQKLMRPMLRSIIKLNSAPVRLRLLALKLWRASWYAETFS